jgi:5'-3' exonuclease
MTLAIIDGDVLAYQACYSIWEDRLKAAGRIRDEMILIALDEDGHKAPIEFTKEEERKALEKAWKYFVFLHQNLMDKLYCEDYLMAVKGPNNFRNLLYPDYKLNRHSDPTKRNIFVPIIRSLAVAEGFAVDSDGREADDLMRIWAEQAMESGDDFIIATIDKDLKCIPGKHYLMNKEIFFEVSKEEARKHYYEQLLKGDPTDHIPGVPKIGNVKAEKLIKPCKNEEEMQEVVVNAYIEAYGEEWYSYFLSNAKMIHLQKDPNDYFKASDWPVLLELR